MKSDNPQSAIRNPQSLGTVAILGVGLIGGSLGLALKETDAAHRVIGWDKSGKSLSIARDRGALCASAASAQEAVTDADLVVLAVPIQAAIPLLRDIAPHLKIGAVVTDVCSTKTRIVAEAGPIIGGRFVGGHPMAGSEESGVEAASANLFTKAVWLLTPTESTDSASVERVERMAQAVRARPRCCDPAEHDRVVGTLSHLPHVLAYGLAGIAGDYIDDSWADAAAGSFRDGTRVANSDPALWTEILLDNRNAVLESLDRFERWLDRARDALQTGNESELSKLLSDARQARKRFPR